MMHFSMPVPMARLRLRLAAVRLVLALFCLSAVPLMAHEGHDHGPPPPPLPTTVKPRIAVHSDTFELVAIASGDRLTLFLDRYGDNAAVADARIEILAGSETIEAKAQPDSTYVAVLKGLDRPGKRELVFNIQHKDGDDLLAGIIEVLAPDQSGDTRRPAPAAQGVAGFGEPGWLVVAAVGILALGLGVLVGRSARPTTLATSLLIAALLSVASPVAPAAAHEGHAPSPAPAAASLSGDSPRRLPDGSVFLPKPSQRLLTIRTQIAIESPNGRAVMLVGRIIADPNRAGIVQSIAGGRVAAPPSEGLPRLGQAVRAGQPLATVFPALPLADQSTLADKMRELEGKALLDEQRLARLNRLSSGTVAKGQMEDIELEIANSRRRLEILRATKILPETLTAPVDGVIAASRVLIGQVVQPQDVLFQIVDPSALWVEALVFDQLEPAAILAATAITGDGRRMTLKLEGRGRALQQQATVLQFSIAEPPPSTAIGQPVSVLARTAEKLTGMLLPRDAVIRGSSGEATVWHHVDPERFVPRQVRVEPFDGDQVLITAGIAPKDRIVVHGAELLAQVR